MKLPQWLKENHSDIWKEWEKAKKEHRKEYSKQFMRSLYKRAKKTSE